MVKAAHQQCAPRFTHIAFVHTSEFLGAFDLDQYIGLALSVAHSHGIALHVNNYSQCSPQ